MQYQTRWGMNSGWAQHICQAQPSCSLLGPALGSWSDAHADTRPPGLFSLCSRISSGDDSWRWEDTNLT